MKKILFLVLCICLLAGAANAQRIVGEGAEQYYERIDTIRIDGSTTVLPIAKSLAERFMSKNPDIMVFVT